ncbi:MAG: hypothetical protein R3Y43_00770 [Alphaproteobacteria bacterium]
MSRVEIRKAAKNFIAENGAICNADARRAFLRYCEALGVVVPPRSKFNQKEEVAAAYEVGSLMPGSEFVYPTNYGYMTASVVDVNTKLQKSTVPTYLVCFSGHQVAHLHTAEVYYLNDDRVDGVLAIGKCGNKGLLETVYNREEGTMVWAEYEGYLRLLDQMLPEGVARANQQICEDTDTQGNFDEMYKFAKAKGLNRVRFVLCTGNPFYERRLLAELMLWLKSNAKDVEMEIVVSHLPLKTDFNVYDGKMGEEMFFGYIAAGIGPLTKDTITIQGKTNSANPERYASKAISGFDWTRVQNIITYYSNMGWPNYQELLYGVPHDEAVENILISHVYAYLSFTPEDYDMFISLDQGMWMDTIYSTQRLW